MRQQDLSIGQKIHLLQDTLVVEPASKAFDATLRLDAIGYFRRDFGPLGAPAGHNTADECGQGSQVSGKPTCGLAWIPLYQGIPYGTILAEVVTHYSSTCKVRGRITDQRHRLIGYF